MRLGVPLSELEQTMDYSEFVELCYYIDLEMTQHTKQDFYLAQIAGMQSADKNAKINDFLIKFEEPKEEKEEDGKAIAEKFKKAFGVK